VAARLAYLLENTAIGEGLEGSHRAWLFANRIGRSLDARVAATAARILKSYPAMFSPAADMDVQPSHSSRATDQVPWEAVDPILQEALRQAWAMVIQEETGVRSGGREITQTDLGAKSNPTNKTSIDIRNKKGEGGGAEPTVESTAEADAKPSDAREIWRRFATLPAVRNDLLVTLDGNKINRHSPRMLDEIAVLCEHIERARKKG
jgi:hypothetical protein